MSWTGRIPTLAVGLGMGVGLAVAWEVLAGLPGEEPSVVVAPAEGRAPIEDVDLGITAVSDPVRRTPVVEAVEQVAPAVVSITTEIVSQGNYSWMMGSQVSSSEGSGVVIDPSGVVLTNAHVVERASRITATFSDGKAYEATVLGIAQELDLAVLRLTDVKRTLSAVPIGTSADLMLGEPVIAIGNPFGLGHTVTTGVVSAIDRPLETDRRVYQDFIQTDASINPGNSGGPLVNAHGQLVGVTTAIRADAEGIGFAIPVDRAMKVAGDLLETGHVQVPWLGMDVTDVTIRRKGRQVGAVSVVHTWEADMGVAEGELIVAVDGREVQGRGDLNAWLAARSPGQSVKLTVVGERGEREVPVKTGTLPELVVNRSLARILGVEVKAAGRGVQVVSATMDGSFTTGGLRAGDLILAVNGEATATPEALKAAITHAKAAHRGQALFTIQRGNVVGRVILTI